MVPVRPPACLPAVGYYCSPPAGQGRPGPAMESYDIIANQPVVIDNVRLGGGGGGWTSRGPQGPPPVLPGPRLVAGPPLLRAVPTWPCIPSRGTSPPQAWQNPSPSAP